MDDAYSQFEVTLETAREIFLQENSLLKKGDIAGHTALMERKKELLKSLDEGIAAFKTATPTASDKTRIRGLQDKIMRLLMLDRENEQLLTKQSVATLKKKLNPIASTALLEKIYKKL